ncbi:ABC transporter substrate-binding protein [Rhodococcus sp. IEGM 1307]|uniref:ABC transporter substrate-binding protein n=1 Tax=Rhodococcus sp. IEGM 1307 TaxID=3047091 RepID=UPI0024B6BA6F|nr:ABC transporter substrate-binding protein [Rhodococcus sp. IEGM 1307]MDI9974453.1 ABC transporter substrate-binding protein [Rhodococcus sp. IEGM 1307]
MNTDRVRQIALYSWILTPAVAVTMALASCGADTSDAGSSDQASIVGLIEIKGDSPNALNDYNNGAQLAVDNVNASGGVLGKPLKYERIPASVTDPQAARTAYLKAVDENPSAIIGFPGGGSLEALTRDVDAAAIPMVHISSDGKLARGAESGSEWLFSINPDDTARATNAVVLARKLGGKRIGIVATDETFGRVSTTNSIDAIEAAGLELGTVRYVPPTATDLTGTILDMRDSDVILSWTFPNVLALQLNQMNQNGIQTPVISGNSGPLVVAGNLVDDTARRPLNAVTPCAPSIGDSAIGRTFASEYQARYGMTPTASATQVYDAVRLLAAAMEEAGTVSNHEAIAESLRSIEWDQGACASVYKSDDAQFLGHQMVAEAFAGDGSIIDRYEVAPTSER